MRDLVVDTSTVIGSLTTLATATVVGSTVDLRGFDSALLLATVGIGGITFDGTNNISIRWQQSDDGSAWTDVTSSDVSVIGGLNSTAPVSNGQIRLINAAHAAPSITSAGYIGTRRYVRSNIVFAGTHGTGTAIITHVVRGDPGNSPA
jgi:hypothetical protein